MSQSFASQKHDMCRRVSMPPLFPSVIQRCCRPPFNIALSVAEQAVTGAVTHFSLSQEVLPIVLCATVAWNNEGNFRTGSFLHNPLPALCIQTLVRGWWWVMLGHVPYFLMDESFPTTYFFFLWKPLISSVVDMLARPGVLRASQT